MKHIEETIRELELGRQWYDQMIRGLKDFLGGRQAFERGSRIEVVGTTDGTETEIHIGNGDEATTKDTKITKTTINAAPRAGGARKPQVVGDVRAKVIACLGSEAISLDDIMERTGFNRKQVGNALTNAGRVGQAKRVGFGLWALGKKHGDGRQAEACTTNENGARGDARPALSAKKPNMAARVREWAAKQKGSFTMLDCVAALCPEAQRPSQVEAARITCGAALIAARQDGLVQPVGKAGKCTLYQAAGAQPSAKEAAYRELRETIHVPRDPEVENEG